MNRMMAALIVGAALCAPVAAWGTADAASAARAQSAQDVLAHLAAHGYASPLQAMQDLRRVPAPSARDPIELRWRWQSTLASFAIRLEDAPAAAAALASLQAMAEHERCTPCATALLLRGEQQAEMAIDLPALRAALARIAAAPEPADAHQRFETWAARSSAHDRLGEYDAAIEAAVRAGELAAVADLPADRVVAITLLASANAGRRDLERAIALSREGYRQAEEIGFLFAALKLRTNEAYSLATRKENTRRREVLLDILRLSRAAPGLERYERTTLINLAAYSNDTHDYRRAVQYATEVERLSAHSSDPNERAFALANRGAALAHLGEEEAGLAQLREGIAIATKTGLKLELVDLVQLLVDTGDDLHRPQVALDALRRVVALNADLTRTQREQAVLQLQEKYAAEQRTREIERLQMQNERAAVELQARTLQQRLWIAIAVAVGLAALMLAQWLSKSRRRSRKLQIANARLSEQTLHDPLTGAFNRRHCELEMARLADEGADAAERCVSLMMVDVDHFKRVNDEHGHAAGDDVLVELARRLRGVLRERDTVVRWGGEEFVLLLPGTPREGLAIVAGRVLRAVGAEPFVLRDGRRIEVRISAGAAAWPVWPGQDWQAALAQADQALYLAKQAGRNRATWIAGLEPRLNGESVAATLREAAELGQVSLRSTAGPQLAPVALRDLAEA